MKKLLLIVMVFMVVNLVGAKSFYDELDPSQRKAFSADWLDTGKAYLDSKDLKNAKACFIYSHELYPMGEAATEARSLLKDKFNKTVSYDADKSFAAFVKRGEKLSGIKSINNYLMALEIKQDAEVLYKIALVYKELDEIDKAKSYAKRAIEAGYDASKIDDDLK